MKQPSQIGVPAVVIGGALIVCRKGKIIGDVSSSKFHVVSQFVRRDALEHELTSISVFSFVAFDRNSQKSNPDCERQDQNGQT